MTPVMKRTSPTKFSYRHILWTRLDAASRSHVDAASISIVGLGHIHGHPPAPC
ncbi:MULTISPECIES: hypothetical protein [unclassified Myxococcus]|jgi:hypothetical protein|uniref:hypothetical protein n=1 Tax=Myxococcus TaxID=32 RepID=UPI001CBCFAC0|nr:MULTISPECIES: hypothetical protein [unclassified Myxococcus]MBZ4399624.1 hypothetical protein [Myxococcus sp. AS-1-15]MBZ4409688.1 hypothetical protein [Myxococcus sp. XM-1-1-1]BDT32100.1 hypothetical protein MFMH1_17690 [Myxococcus sp. MH1]